LPGQAQPYYPGDPLPVMQSRTSPPSHEATLAAAEVDPMPSATENLKWGSPKAEPQAVAAAPTVPALVAQPPAQAIATTPPPQPVVASAEPTVAIPADGSTLRFATATPPEPQPFMPPAASPMEIQPAPNQVATSPGPQAVIPASYFAANLASPEPTAPNPWRAPELSPSSFGQQPLTLPPPPAPSMAAPAAAPTQWPITAPPLFAATNPMDVRLRAVPSPQVDSYSSTPRIRMPGHETTPYVSSNDGFRPRSSMR
jgi:hypothetical protein